MEWEFAWLSRVSGTMPLSGFFCCGLAVALKECVEASKGLFFNFIFLKIIISFIWKHGFSSLLQMLYAVIVYIYWST